MKRHIFFLGLLALLLCSCGTERQVVYQTQYRDRIVEHRDSIFIHEDTHTSERQKGDTVYITAETVRYVYKDRLRCDTLVQRDSIPYKVEVPVNILTGWQKRQIAGFWVLAVGIVLYVVWRIPRLLR